VHGQHDAGVTCSHRIGKFIKNSILKLEMKNENLLQNGILQFEFSLANRQESRWKVFYAGEKGLCAERVKIIKLHS